MGQRVSQLAALMNGSGSLGRNVAGNASRKAKLLEEASHSLPILRNVWVDFAIRALHIGMRDKRGAAVAGTYDVNHIEVFILDDAVQVNVDKVQTWCSSPVS